MIKPNNSAVQNAGISTPIIGARYFDNAYPSMDGTRTSARWNAIGSAQIVEIVPVVLVLCSAFGIRPVFMETGRALGERT